MRECNTEFPTMKELETLLFRKLQEQFAAGMAHILEALDEYLMHQRDHSRFRLKDQREVQIDTLFGTVRFKRRLYQNCVKGQHVFLLDRMLAFNGQALSHEAIRDKLITRMEQGATVLPEATRRVARVLFVEVDGLYTSLQRQRQRGMENRMAMCMRDGNKRRAECG